MTGGPSARRDRSADAVVTAERDHIRARLRRLAVDHRALKAAIEDHFGPDLDRERWAAAFDSDEPQDVNLVAPVVSAFERMVTGLVEAARSGLTASGISRPAGTPHSVRADLELVHGDGGLSAGQLELLVGLSRTRNHLQHVYVEVTADDARAAIGRLRANLPGLVKALNEWFKRYDVGA